MSTTEYLTLKEMSHKPMSL